MSRSRIIIISGIAIIVIVIILGAILMGNRNVSKLNVQHFGDETTLTAIPWKDGNNSVVINVDGFTTYDYALKIGIYYRYPGSKSDSLLQNEVIHIPGGKVEAEFRRDYYGSKGVGKVTATIIGARHATGEVDISMSIQ
ncbi:hypothetical protein MUK70_10580 [Dyadobacter chenwenxiniae]|uniref:Uncharacterized protein n=1 Tax=Dyadobacter chenwenxiniae TaxID=2906456 RepID=A0A9X1TFZ4_9BACT|nr:hypothetical protein [Dyadobacter chenwenxiniae]MCF0063189.1 hypothetical protein [Dyadobacter chenwenxiniae]UON85431.1 hypothetical protein MUK70_10580 [Dyadobacter chenwenxiniae]